MPGVNTIDGIVSNLDTTAIVEAMIQAERGRVTLMEAQQVSRTDQMTVYNSISALLLGLKAKVSAMTRPSAFDKNSITISDDSFVAAAVSGGITPGSYRIAVDQLASNHQIASQGFADATATNIGTGSFKIAVGSGSVATITIDSTNNTLEGLVRAVNDADAGVSASIFNDGTSSNPYRLLLTSDSTGSGGRITVTSQLSGGITPDFANSSFDSPELLGWSSSATATVSLGSTASYTGSANKAYTFTVGGSGVQTIGTDEISVDWSDGVNSGTIVVSEADVDLVLGTEGGADGLALSFGAGTLVGGDSFQVQAFGPLVQAAQDAKVSMGSPDGGGSPIVITSSTNTIEELIPGVTLSLKRTTGEDVSAITITTDKDTTAVHSMIGDFLSQYNEVIKRIDEYLKYDPETEEAGTLQGDSTLISIRNRLRLLTSSTVEGLDSGYRMLADIGIRTSSLGELNVIDSRALSAALSDNLADVTRLFTSWGRSSNPEISFLSSTNATRMSSVDGYDVQITQVATRGFLRGTAITDPAQGGLVIDDSNDTLKLRVNGIVSDEIVLENRIYSSFADLVTELQGKIDHDAKIGSSGVAVSYVDTGGTGYLRLESSSYGSNSKVEIQAGVPNSAFIALGLAQGTVFAGQDVAGTINGEDADGFGQTLTGKRGNATTEGLRLKIELDEDDLSSDTEASVVLVKGIASQFDDMLDSLTRSSDGLLARRAGAIQKQIDYTTERIEEEEERLAIRQIALFNKFYEMEKLLNQLSAQGAFLETQLSQLSNYWKWQSNLK